MGIYRRTSKPKKKHSAYSMKPGKVTEELFAWLANNRPQLFEQLTHPAMLRKDVYARMNSETGKTCSPAMPLEDACKHWIKVVRQVEEHEALTVQRP